MADRLVEQDARPARAEHDRHRAGGGVDRVEVGERLAGGLAREAFGAAVGERRERQPSAAAVGALLAVRAALRNAGDGQMDQRTDVADEDARRVHDEHDAVLDAETGEHVGDGRVRGAGRGVEPLEEGDLVGERRVDGRFGERVEVVRRARPARHRQRRIIRTLVGDEARRAGGDLEPLERHLIGVRVARPRPGEDANAHALAHVPGCLLDDALLERRGLVHPELEEALGVVGATLEGRAEDTVESRGRQPEALEEEPARIGDIHDRGVRYQTVAGEATTRFRRYGP